jgi:hypothetical protein
MGKAVVKCLRHSICALVKAEAVDGSLLLHGQPPQIFSNPPYMQKDMDWMARKRHGLSGAECS